MPRRVVLGIDVVAPPHVSCRLAAKLGTGGVPDGYRVKDEDVSPTYHVPVVPRRAALDWVKDGRRASQIDSLDLSPFIGGERDEHETLDRDLCLLT